MSGEISDEEGPVDGRERDSSFEKRSPPDQANRIRIRLREGKALFVNHARGAYP